MYSEVYCSSLYACLSDYRFFFQLAGVTAVILNLFWFVELFLYTIQNNLAAPLTQFTILNRHQLVSLLELFQGTPVENHLVTVLRNLRTVNFKTAIIDFNWASKQKKIVPFWIWWMVKATHSQTANIEGQNNDYCACYQTIKAIG